MDDPARHADVQRLAEEIRSRGEPPFRLESMLSDTLRDDEDLLTARALVLVGADVETPNLTNTNLLLRACKKLDLKVAEFLLESGANIARVNRDGLGDYYLFAALLAQPMHVFTTQYRDTLCVSFIDLGMRHGLDLGLRDSNKRMPLHTACAQGLYRSASRLLELGLSVNDQDGFGQTPLHYAAKNDHREICQLLMGAGADLDLKCLRHQTAATAASKLGHTQIAEEIRARKQSMMAMNAIDRAISGSASSKFVLPTQALRP